MSFTLEQEKITRITRDTFLAGSDIYTDKNNRNSPYYFVNGNSVEKLSKRKKDILDSIFLKEHRTVLDEKLESVPMAVVHKHPRLPIRDFIGGDIRINEYKNPEHIYGLDDSMTEMPVSYQKYFQHLIPDDVQRDYLLDWISFSLIGKNQTFMTLIGDQGIGKSTLASILSILHLEDNFAKVKSSQISSRFNSILEGKTLVLVEEFDFSVREQVDSAKCLSDDTLNIEGKGVNDKTIPIFLNLMLISNRDDAYRVTETERRFSILDTATKSLLDSFSPSEITKLKNENNCNSEEIKKLYHYFRNRKIKSNLSVPMRGRKLQEMIELTSSEWELETIKYLKANGGIKKSAKDILKYLSLHYHNKMPGESTIYKLLKERYKTSITSSKHGSTGEYFFIYNGEIVK